MGSDCAAEGIKDVAALSGFPNLSSIMIFLNQPFSCFLNFLAVVPPLRCGTYFFRLVQTMVDHNDAGVSASFFPSLEWFPQPAWPETGQLIVSLGGGVSKIRKKKKVPVLQLPFWVTRRVPAAAFPPKRHEILGSPTSPFLSPIPSPSITPITSSSTNYRMTIRWEFILGEQT